MTTGLKDEEKSRQIPDGAVNILKLFNNAKYEAYLVGGCVRDLLLKVKPHDFDICTNATPDEIEKLLKNNGYKYHTLGIKFGTITARCDDGEYEITTYRADSKEYSDNRRPDSVRFITDISEDLARRDFTINAIAYNPLSNEFVDKFGGCKDLLQHKISAVGDPDERFKEDALRILRALRFAIKYDLEIDVYTKQAMINNKELLQNISKERITSELEKMLTSGKDIKGWFNEYSWLIAEIIPEIKPTIGFNQNNKYHWHDVYEHMLYVVDGCKTNDFIIKLAALLHDTGKPSSYTEDSEGWGHFYGHPLVSKQITEEIIKKRLRLSREQSDMLLELVEFHDMTLGKTKASVRRALNKHGEEFFEKWFILKESDVADHKYSDTLREKYGLADIKDLAQQVLDEESCFSLRDLAVNGNDIMKELNLKPGKQVGEILNALLNEVIDEKIENNKESLLARTSELYN